MERAEITRVDDLEVAVHQQVGPCLDVHRRWMVARVIGLVEIHVQPALEGAGEVRRFQYQVAVIRHQRRVSHKNFAPVGEVLEKTERGDHVEAPPRIEAGKVLLPEILHLVAARRQPGG